MNKIILIIMFIVTSAINFALLIDETSAKEAVANINNFSKYVCQLLRQWIDIRVVTSIYLGFFFGVIIGGFNGYYEGKKDEHARLMEIEKHFEAPEIKQCKLCQVIYLHPNGWPDYCGRDCATSDPENMQL